MCVWQYQGQITKVTEAAASVPRVAAPGWHPKPLLPAAARSCDLGDGWELRMGRVPGLDLRQHNILNLLACPTPGCATSGCGEGQMSCQSGHCLPLSLLCDGQDDCGDGTDEEGCPCPHGFLACADGRCLPPTLLCNGHPDCLDAADEESCLGEESLPLPRAH